MQEAVPVGNGSMLAVLGLKEEEINNYILQLKSKAICEIANDNAPGQIIISGNTETIEEFKNLLKKTCDQLKELLIPPTKDLPKIQLFLENILLFLNHQKLR